MLKSVSLYDRLGRTIETRQYETTSSYIASKVTYDALGRVKFSYNPHRTTTEVTYGWTETTYDGLSRVTRVESFDKDGISTGAAHTAYSGNQVLVTDQAGKQRISKTNALGQLVEVWEVKPADSATENISFPEHPEVTAGYRSTYAYNALNSLTTVTQRIGASGTTQTRSFEYDSLQRLKRATNPESENIWYTYDNNSNVVETVDQASRYIYFVYDALNRITSKSGAIPEALYYYDNQALPSQPAGFDRGSAVGRLVAVTAQPASGGPFNPPPFGSFYSYDIAGRVKQSYQRIDGADYGFTNIIYNRADEQTSVNYPSGRSVTTAYDGAGRIASTYTTTGTTTVNLSSAISYSPAGALTSELYGNSLIHAITYNSRLQPTSINLGFEGNPGAIFKLTYFYGQLNIPTDPDSMIDASKNNGNIARTRLFWDAVEQYSQTYRYDPLNRIQDYVLHLEGITDPAHEYIKETYEYDRFGNRGMNNSASTSWGPPLSYFNPANNRISASPYQYSSVGNLTREPLLGGPLTVNYAYNAENKIVTAGTAGYEYDGEGQRVKITSTYAGASRRMVYNAVGKLIAEYTLSGSLIKEYFYRGGQLLATIGADGTVKFGTADHLGSVREWTQGDGSLVVDGTHDYTPFGLDLYPGGQHDGQRQQFGSKERDIETGLDYFIARYYASIQGRFTSPDRPFVDQNEFNPQSWNLYAYVRNNPLRGIDPQGDSCYYTESGSLIGCDGDARIKIADGKLYFTEKKGSAPIVYDLNKLKVQEEISAGGNTAEDFAIEMDRRASGIKGLIGITIGAGVVGGTGVGVGLYALGGGAGVTTLGINWGREAWRVVRASRPLEKMGHAAKHLKDFQQYANVTKEEVAKILEYVRQTGTQVGSSFGGRTLEKVVEIGASQVRVRVVESAGGIIKTGFPVR